MLSSILNSARRAYSGAPSISRRAPSVAAAARKASDAVRFSWGSKKGDGGDNGIVLKRESDTETKFPLKRNVVVSYNDFEHAQARNILKEAGLSGNNHKLSTGLCKLGFFKAKKVFYLAKDVN